MVLMVLMMMVMMLINWGGLGVMHTERPAASRCKSSMQTVPSYAFTAMMQRYQQSADAVGYSNTINCGFVCVCVCARTQSF